MSEGDKLKDYDPLIDYTTKAEDTKRGYGWYCVLSYACPLSNSREAIHPDAWYTSKKKAISAAKHFMRIGRWSVKYGWVA